MEGSYFREFGVEGFGTWKGHMKDHVANTTENRCSIYGKQSPIDIYQTFGDESDCTATHQIRWRVRSMPFVSYDFSKKYPHFADFWVPTVRSSCEETDPAQ